MNRGPPAFFEIQIRLISSGGNITLDNFH